MHWKPRHDALSFAAGWLENSTHALIGVSMLQKISLPTVT